MHFFLNCFHLKKKTNLIIPVFCDTVLMLITSLEINISLKTTMFLMDFDQLIDNVNVDKFDSPDNRLFIFRPLFSTQLCTY